MKIGLVTSYYDESVFQNETDLARFLIRRANDVTIYTSKLSPPWVNKGKILNEETKIDGLNIVRLDSTGREDNIMVLLEGLRGQLKKDRPEIVHFQEWFMPSITSTYMMDNIVVTARKPTMDRQYKILCGTLGWWVFRHAKAVTAISRKAKELVENNCNAKDVEYIPNGVDVDRFKPMDFEKKDEINILTVGRLSIEKGIHTLIKACSILDYEFNLRVVGRGKELWNLKKLAREEGVEKIKFDRVSPEYMPTLYNQSDIYVHTSHREPFGLSVIEAMACGVPVIVSHETQCMSEHDVLKFKAGDHKTLANILNSRNFDSKKSLNIARKHFDWNTIACKYENTYKGVYRKN
jgi:glycosyltransferase involved in cell wall biosynthesis